MFEVKITLPIFVLLLFFFQGCVSNSTQEFLGPSDYIGPNQLADFGIKCGDDFKFCYGKDAGCAFYNSEGELLEYCGTYAENPALEQCELFNSLCPE